MVVNVHQTKPKARIVVVIDGDSNSTDSGSDSDEEFGVETGTLDLRSIFGDSVDDPAVLKTAVEIHKAPRAPFSEDVRLLSRTGTIHLETSQPVKVLREKTITTDDEYVAAFLESILSVEDNEDPHVYKKLARMFRGRGQGQLISFMVHRIVLSKLRFEEAVRGASTANFKRVSVAMAQTRERWFMRTILDALRTTCSTRKLKSARDFLEVVRVAALLEEAHVGMGIASPLRGDELGVRNTGVDLDGVECRGKDLRPEIESLALGDERAERLLISRAELEEYCNEVAVGLPERVRLDPKHFSPSTVGRLRTRQLLPMVAASTVLAVQTGHESCSRSLLNLCRAVTSKFISRVTAARRIASRHGTPAADNQVVPPLLRTQQPMQLIRLGL
jgi:hypothetical protein